jgi:hypothetical protein
MEASLHCRKAIALAALAVQFVIGDVRVLITG